MTTHPHHHQQPNSTTTTTTTTRPHQHHTLRAEEWEYKSEGLGNMVLSYRGRDARLVGRVLRLSKEQCGTPSEQQQTFVHTFMQRVMQPLIGRQWIDCGVRVPVERQFLQRVSQRVEPERPQHRRDGGERVDLDALHVLLMTDHTHQRALRSNVATRDVFCIEIKPKWGVMCRSHLVRNEHQRILKRTVCRYCMHQQYKLHRGDIPRASRFCPIDLFSSDPASIAHALHGLCDDPQNNMKLFINGQLVWWGDANRGEEAEDGAATAADQMDYRSQLAHLLRKHPLPRVVTSDNDDDAADDDASMDGGEEDDNDDDDTEAVSNFVRIVKRCLVRSGILQRIRRVQMLDRLDIDVVHRIYENLLKRGHSVDSLHSLMYDLSDRNQEEAVAWVARLNQELSQMSDEISFRCRAHETDNDISSSGADDDAGIGDGADELDRDDDAAVAAAAVARGMQDDSMTLSPEQERALLERCMNDDDEAIHALRCFLIAQTAKDCSIMMTIQPCELSRQRGDTIDSLEEDEPLEHDGEVDGVLQLEGRGRSVLRYRMVVVDLDPKVVYRLQHYWKFDARIVEQYKKAKEQLEE